MVRKIFAILLVLSLFWQSASIAGAVLENAEEPSHAVLHWQDADHHHHEDGSLHSDDSAGTFQHMHSEGGANSAGLVTMGWNDVAPTCAGGPVVIARLPHPAPFIQGLLRPPTAHS